MTWQMKALIGATGGLALVLLKLIEVQFFVDDFGSKKALAAYLTYSAYVFLGIIVAVFFTDESLEDSKKRRSAFFAGLLAPSILLAVIRQPSAGPEAEFFKSDPAPIPKLSTLFIGEAYAQTPRVPAGGGAGTIQVIEFKKTDVEPGFVDGLKAAIGRAEPSKNYVYVLGEAGTKEKAVEVAAGVNKVLASQSRPAGTTAYVMRPEGSNEWYVTVGKFDAPFAAVGYREAAQSAAITTLTAPATPSNDKATARLMLEGRVVKGATLFGNM